MLCRFCKAQLNHEFIDLLNAPASNSFLTKEQLNEPEIFYPLKVFVCDQCFLVQIDEYKKSDAIFNSEYVYFSSYSSSWLTHAKQYVEMMTRRFDLNKDVLVIEIASNDGYLLQYFLEKNIPVLGIEPAENTANAARQKGIETITEFFGTILAEKLVAKGIKADLLLGNNVLAHVPNIVDFVTGMKTLLREEGIITMEFPHLMQLVDNNQFDTIYHEHFSYLSFHTVSMIFSSVGLELFDVDEIPTHGGSLRIFAKHAGNKKIPVAATVASLLGKEKDRDLTNLNYYRHFGEKALEIKIEFLDFLIAARKEGKKVAAYGAAAKGNTFLNYCGVKNDLIQFVADANPAKQNKFLPGSHIKAVHKDLFREIKPDYIVIFPWNIKEEIMAELGYIREWNGKFVTAIPKLEVR
jgi:C-methyltransferase C-terminal domain/Putative zinc binding domain/Methyltransferase domain